MRTKDVLRKLEELGMAVELRRRQDPACFLRGVWIEAGVLCAVAGAAAGSVLHEAGHLAITPSRFRPLIRPGSISEFGAELNRAYRSYMEGEAGQHGPDHWLTRAVLNSGEQEAISWSYAAAVQVGLPPERIFLMRRRGLALDEQPYGGNGAAILQMHRLGAAPGIHGLQHGGMTVQKQWPRMLRWMQD